MVGQRKLLKMLHCKGIRVKRVRSDGASGPAGEGPSHDKGIRRVDFMKMNEYSTCRVCLKNGSIPIFGHDKSDYISKGLNFVGGITVRIDDPFPKFLCESCNELLQGAIILRRKAQQSDKLLKQPVHDVSESDHILDYLEDIKSEYVDKYLEKQPPNVQEIKSENDQNKVESQTGVQDIRSHYDKKNDNNLSNKVIPIKQEKGDEKKQKKSISNIKFVKVEPGGLNFCKRCKKSFKSFNELHEHRMSEEHVNMKQSCPVCHGLYSVRYYRKHLAMHKGEAPFLCDICGKNFLRQTTFKMHRLSHFYQLPYKCALCPYKGRSKEAMKMHMRTHTGEKPYQCTLCPSKFINSSNLTKHMRVHNRVRAFQCDSCGKGYHSKQELEIHIKVEHLGIKDHVCTQCGKEFGHRKQMMKHQLKVHKREKLRPGKMPVYLQVEMMKQQGNDVADET